ncbi:DUF1963 domain-containing protein [Micromonospora sp. NPDC127501]|uniref:DUF1963 domain-containing protein n=1 Tax=Micromonospora sp. NPDC127501 TaxID=3154872 RepID=UPI003333D481
MGIPDDEIGRFTTHLRLSIRLGGGSGDSPVGQFGGLPRLPVGMDWPTAGPSPLPFVFSVDCAALPRVDGFGLPADGSLLFFLNHQEDHLAGGTGDRRYARVVYVPADAATEVAEEPGNPTFVGEQYDLHARLRPELPPWIATDDEDDDDDGDDVSPFQQQLARDLEVDLPHLDELRALADDLWPPDEGLASAEIGGYADDEVIRSIAEQTLAGREKAGEIVVPVAQWYTQLKKEQHRLTSEWVSLARFSPADEFYYGSFVIRHDDLAAGRLDLALSVTEFSE